jgi:hypothetical protein
MSPDRARPLPFRYRQFGHRLVGAFCATMLGCTLAIPPIDAQAHSKPKLTVKRAAAQHERKEPFGAIPKGPLQIIISVDQQKLHLYSDGTAVADTLIATGVPSHATPLGVFSIIQKSRYHRSNIYSGAPMPYMQRITWSGVAMHQGVGVGHPASHGCIRMPESFATRLWTLTRLGARVIIARPELQPTEFADPQLFVHEEKPPAPVPSVSAQPDSATEAVTKPLKTAQTSANEATDAPRDGGLSAPNPDPGRDTADPPAAAEAAPTNAVSASDPVTESAPMPLPKAADILRISNKAPITIFISRKDKKIYVRQDFAPLFDAPITIEQPEQRFGTFVFTALNYLGDHTAFRWNIIAVPDEQKKLAQRAKEERRVERNPRARHRSEPVVERPLEISAESAHAVLARIEIPQDTIDHISQLMVPGSSLIVSDQGLGEETGEGTSFIVLTH